MKKLSVLMTLLILTMNTTAFASRPSELDKMWKYGRVERSGQPQSEEPLFNHAQGFYSTTEELPGLIGNHVPIATVGLYIGKAPDTLLVGDISKWQTQLFKILNRFEESKPPTITSEKIKQRDGRFYYSVDYVVSYDANTNHQGKILMAVVGDEMRILIFEGDAVPPKKPRMTSDEKHKYDERVKLDDKIHKALNYLFAHVDLNIK
jgi:hypothetical protein